MVRNTFPQFYLLELHGRSLNYSEQVVYVSDEASCEGVTLPCNQFSVEDNVVHLPFIANMSQVHMEHLPNVVILMGVSSHSLFEFYLLSFANFVAYCRNIFSSEWFSVNRGKLLSLCNSVSIIKKFNSG